MSAAPWPPVHPSARVLLPLLRDAYGLGAGAHCEFLVSGLHHNYRIEDDGITRVCRVYRRAWRSHNDALFELEVLDQLRHQHCPVAYPIRTLDGQLAIEGDTPQGRVTMALFSYAEGAPPGDRITVAQSARLGRALAGLHQAMSPVTTPHRRRPRDLAWLIDASLNALAPVLDPPDHAELTADSRAIRAQMPDLPARPPYFGLIHGDVNLKNVHFAGDALTFIDFDDCGPGWYAYDIGKFFHASDRLPAAPAVQAALLEAYRSERPLSAGELASIPYFTAVAQLWVMAVHAYNAEYLAGYLRPEFWQRGMARWRVLCARLGGAADRPGAAQ